MLPTLGLFRAFPCPYYVVGLCERPHCSFRHSRSDVEAARRQASGQDLSADTSVTSYEDTAVVVPDQKGSSPATSPLKGQRRSTAEPVTDLLTRDEAKSETNSSWAPEKSSPRKSRSSGSRLSKKEKRGSESSVSLEDECHKKRLKLEVIVPDGGSDSSRNVSESQSRKDHNSNRKSSSSSIKSSHKKDGSHSSKSSKSSHKHRKHQNDKKEPNESDRTNSTHRSSSRSHRSDSTSSSKHSDSNPSKKSNGQISTPKSSSHKSKHLDKSNSESGEWSPSKRRSKSELEPLREVKKSLESNVFNGEVVTLDDDDLQNTMESDFDDVRDNFLCPSDEDDDAEEIALECFTLFKQYNKDDKVTSTYNLETLPEAKPSASETEPALQVGKKRVAHDGAEKPSLIKPAVPVPPKRKESLAHQLQRRFQAAQEAMGNQPPLPACSPAPEAPPASSSSKKRIAHVTNISALVKAPPKPTTKTAAPMPNESKPHIPATLSQTATKGEKRVAHVPTKILSASTGSAPTIVPDSRSKVPLLVRQKFMDQIFRECVQIYDDGDSARMRALEEETSLVSRCSSKQVYTCSAVNLITRLRKEYRNSSSETSGGPLISGTTRTVSHNEILAGKAGSNISWSIEKKTVYRPVGVQLYSKMTEYLMSLTELEDHGFPIKCPISFKECSGLAVIKPRDDAASKRGAEDEYRKTCDRCGASFTIDDEGFPRTKEACTYHSGRKFGRRTRTGNAEARYNCCDGEANSIGCCTAVCHVHTTKAKDYLKNFICAALEPGNRDSMGSDAWDIIAVDCEMVYTTGGSELARATFVGVDGKILYDTLVKPPRAVLDYNTRYSGIDESMLVDTSTTISDVHLKILANVKPNSIIIGHSLENDLIALKLIHNTVIDTSVVFPHKRGLPFKRALRNLSADYLGKIIQVGEGGHDSAEDARAALDLMLWKVRNDSSKGQKRSTSVID